MLTESQVIQAVADHLSHTGWTIMSICHERQRGDDIVARHVRSKVSAVIEAKGETSAQEHTRRFGKPFDSRQVTSHVSRAFFRAAQTVGSDQRGGIALPNTTPHVECVRRIEAALRALSLEVFWVNADLKVTRADIWPRELRSGK